MTKETEAKAEAIKNLIGFLPVDSDEGIDHYHKSIFFYDMGLTDADDYAWLNTLFRYDIGAERAKAIINWYYENLDTTVQDAVSVDQKETLKNICEMELGFHLDFTHWPKYEPEYLEYGFKEYYEEGE